MSDDARFEQIVKSASESLADLIIREEDWTPELALSVLRENRRRYAHEPRMQATTNLGGRLARELAAETGVAPADIVTVLLRTGSKLAGLAVAGVDAQALTDVMHLAADDLDQQARAASSNGAR
ncbi:hypothetical protein AB0P17_36405 [Streptomyces sp. NPDC088124]|uniref:hypothetical protein n=1 Tax=Streptomyces sp. NPDC088124 TaxID=3154654 RepID=UPI003423161E